MKRGWDALEEGSGLAAWSRREQGGHGRCENGGGGGGGGRPRGRGQKASGGGQRKSLSVGEQDVGEQQRAESKILLVHEI